MFAGPSCSVVCVLNRPAVRDPIKPSVQGFRKVRGSQSHTECAPYAAEDESIVINSYRQLVQELTQTNLLPTFLLGRLTALSPPNMQKDLLSTVLSTNARVYLPQTNRKILKELTSWLLPPLCCPNTVLTRLMSATSSTRTPEHPSRIACQHIRGCFPVIWILRNDYSLAYLTI